MVVACTTTCTDVPAETRTLVLAPRDAGPDAPLGARPLDECKPLCGDTDDSKGPHVTACRLSITDAGDSVVACDETAYRLCGPE
jgi:hypothetical protein